MVGVTAFEIVIVSWFDVTGPQSGFGFGIAGKLSCQLFNVPELFGLISTIRNFHEPFGLIAPFPSAPKLVLFVEYPQIEKVEAIGL